MSYPGHPRLSLFSIRRSRNGKGVFCSRDYRRGQTLFRVNGVIVHHTEVSRRGGSFQNNTFRFGPQTYLSPTDDLGNFLNHSCEPTARITKKDRHIYVVAHALIRKGTEITIDYSTILAEDDMWRMRCNCGKRTCRRIIQRYPLLPPEILKKYTKSGLIPHYILRI